MTTREKSESGKLMLDRVKAREIKLDNIKADSKKKRQKLIDEANATRKRLGLRLLAKGGLAEATAKLKAKGMKEGGMVVKDKVVSIDTSPNSGLITTKGFGAGRRT
jgi:hypothetical protein